MLYMDHLFAVQDEDVLHGQLQHRLRELPERSQFEDACNTELEMTTRIEEFGLERLALVQKESRLESEVMAIEIRLEELNEKLYSGAITTDREASSLQGEIENLRSRKDDLESQVIEIMEDLDSLDGRLSDLSEKAKMQAVLRSETEKALGKAESTVATELEDCNLRRDSAAQQLGEEILSSYEKSRMSFGASAVVRFDGSNCKGCPLSMPAVEVDRVRGLSLGTIAECRECGRIVVR